MSDLTIGRSGDGDLAEILRTYERFWGDRELLRYLHHPMFFCEFGDTALVARQASQIVGYLLGFVGPAGDGYIHLVAVRDDARTLGIGRRLYEKFAAAAAVRGATVLKAITSPENEGSIAFHRRIALCERGRYTFSLSSDRTRALCADARAWMNTVASRRLFSSMLLPPTWSTRRWNGRRDHGRARQPQMRPLAL
jgi:ribosomal protein S18 acetylase RimI-like enzyme